MHFNSYEGHFLTAAIVVISLALVFYSVGVWGERIQKRLKGWHVLFFGLGLACDFIGTSLMAKLVRFTGHDDRLHAILGIIAVCLMAVHAVWAFRTYRKGSEKARHNFSRFSIVVWCIWLIPYFIGMYLGMTTQLG